MGRFLYICCSKYKYNESREVSQSCLSLPEAYLIFYKYSESREKGQACLNVFDK